MLQPVTVVQYEASGRTLAITLTSGSLPVNLSGCDVIFYAQKPDGNILFNNCEIVDAAVGDIEYTITEQTVAVDGILRCWIVIIKDGATVRTQGFDITVQASPNFTSAVESTDEFSDLEVALATIAGFNARLTTAEGSISILQGDMAAAQTNIAIAQSSLDNGWIPINAICEYVSPTSIRLMGNYTGRIGKNNPIKLTQATIKYFNILSAPTYDSGTDYTTLQLVPNDDYSVANAAISAPHYSKTQIPQGFPAIFNWSPEITGFSSNPTGGIYQYSICSGVCELFMRQPNAGVSNAGTLTLSLPIAAVVKAGAGWAAPCVVMDGGTVQSAPGVLFVGSGGTTLSTFKNYALNAFTTSGNKCIPYGAMRYPIA